MIPVWHCTHPCSILPRPCPWRSLLPRTPSASPLRPRKPKLISHSRFSCSTNYGRWDSYVVLITRSCNFYLGGKDKEAEDCGKKRRWGSDESSEIKDGDSGDWKETIDYIRIFKVFRFYVWTSTIIFLSALLASSLKAFLMMALALPLIQSALQLAFEILWGRVESKPKPWSRRKRILFVSTASGIKIEEELEETQETGKGKRGYQSWGVENGDSVDRGSRNAGGYGGWDDLDESGPDSSKSSLLP